MDIFCLPYRDFHIYHIWRCGSRCIWIGYGLTENSCYLVYVWKGIDSYMKREKKYVYIHFHICRMKFMLVLRQIFISFSTSNDIRFVSAIIGKKNLPIIVTHSYIDISYSKHNNIHFIKGLLNSKIWAVIKEFGKF